MEQEQLQVFKDWWLHMSEQGFSGEVLSESGVELEHLCTPEYTYMEGDPVSFSQLREEDRKKILARYGGLESMRERLENDGYGNYRIEEDEESEEEAYFRS